MSNLWRLIRLFLKHWPILAVSLLAMIIVAAGNAAVTSLVGALFESLADADNVAEATVQPSLDMQGVTGFAKVIEGWRQDAQTAIEARFPKSGLAVPILLAIFLILKNGAQMLAQIAVNWIGLRVVRDLRQQLYESVLDKSIRFFTDHTTGELTSHLINDLERIQTSVGKRLGNIVQDALIVAILFLYVVTLNTSLAVLVFILAPLVLFPILKIARRLKKIALGSQERVAALTETLQESIRGHRIVKAFCGEQVESDRFAVQNTSYYRTLLREAWMRAASNPIMETVAGIGMIGIFVYAQHQIAAGRASLAIYVSFVTGMALLYAPLKRLNQSNLALQEASAAAERVFPVLDLPKDVDDRPGAATLAAFEDRVRFDAVGFSYPGTPDVLQGIDLTIERGEVVALVGPSGGGKTTMAHLLLRFYDVTEGRICIDGHDLRDLTQRSLRSHMALVTQDVFLFNDTVHNNIAYGRADTSREQIVEAAEAAFAHDFIEALPNGYDTVVGEAGSRLSGGQRQRIAIARALLKDAPILILDEATSALDVESELKVQRALENLMKDRTTMVVAHRLSTIRKANRIVVLEQGRIVEVGNHDELLAADGTYARLHRLHSFNEPTADGATPGDEDI